MSLYFLALRQKLLWIMPLNVVVCVIIYYLFMFWNGYTLIFWNKKKLLDYVEINHGVLIHELISGQPQACYLIGASKIHKTCWRRRATSCLLVLTRPQQKTKGLNYRHGMWLLPKCLKILRTQIIENTIGVELGVQHQRLTLSSNKFFENVLAMSFLRCTLTSFQHLHSCRI